MNHPVSETSHSRQVENSFHLPGKAMSQIFPLERKHFAFRSASTPFRKCAQEQIYRVETPFPVLSSGLEPALLEQG
jgi:hypothetical protein